MPDFESLIDIQIREAQARGEFDNLPGSGKPIERLHQRDPDWWLKEKMRSEGIAPPPSESALLRDEVAELEHTLRSLPTESEVRTVVVDLNKRLSSARLRQRGLMGRLPGPVDTEAAVQRWREGRR